MLIAQITDLHIGREGASPDNDRRLDQVMARIADHHPDVILATGDLTEGGAPEAFARVKARLSALAVPVLPVVGNHDRREALLDAFGLAADDAGFVQYVRDLDDLRLIVLDTIEVGRHGGAFCERRAAWLQARLDEAPTRPTLIALHHPPFKTAIAWMDEPAGGPWSQRLLEALEGRGQVVGLVAGHLHRPVAARFAGHPFVIAPSVAPQLVLDLDEAPPRAFRPRIIAEPPGFALHLWRDGCLVSHFASASDSRVIAGYDPQTGLIVPT